jgi:UDP:flavonoid glycosyltransferase YjiC (YdhE family)
VTRVQLIGPTLTTLARRDDVLVLADTDSEALSASPMALPANVVAAGRMPFESPMPHLELLVTNGGFGSVTHALRQGVPIVVAGVGIDLRTATPSVDQLRTAIDEVLDDVRYELSVATLAGEYADYDARKAWCSLLERIVSQR